MSSVGGLSIAVSASVLSGDSGQVKSLIANQDRILSYNHEIEAVGGYTSASVEIATDEIEAWMWIENGLGKDITVYGPGGGVAWEGFVNEVAIAIGNLEVTIGPLMEIANKVKVKYQTISWDIPGTPVRGESKETAYASDSFSQERFGVVEEIVNIGEASETLNQPTNVRDTYLKEFAWPKPSQEVTIGSPSEPSVNLSCIGYQAALEMFYYSKTGTVSSLDAKDKIVDVLQADPNSVLDSTDSLMDENTTPVSDHEEGNSTGWDVILDTISYGTHNQNRYILGVTDGRRVYGREIDPVNPDVRYSARTMSERPVINSIGGGEVPLSLVRPGVWVFVSDSQAGGQGTFTSTSTVYNDPRYIFIEGVSFDLEGTLRISGGTLNNVNRMIARIGLDTLYT